MLGVKTYSQEFIDGSRARVDASIAAYRTLAASTSDPTAVAAFESAYFADLVIVLDALFMHRLRTVEGKDGNPMNEVRVLSSSLIFEGGVMTADKTIKMPPEKTVLGIAYGSPIRLTEADFIRLMDAYFAAIETAFSDRVAQPS